MALEVLWETACWKFGEQSLSFSRGGELIPGSMILDQAYQDHTQLVSWRYGNCSEILSK